jgi:hypothetical protein
MDMKKQLVILGTIVLLVCVGLSGCNKQPTSTPPIQKTYLNGWYYIYSNSSCKPFDSLICHKGSGYNVIFSGQENTKKMRLIVNKSSPEDIEISIGTDSTHVIHTFNTSDTYLDEEYSIERSYPSQSYYLWSINGDVKITVLEYFSNVESSLIINSCGGPVKYNGGE